MIKFKSFFVSRKHSTTSFLRLNLEGQFDDKTQPVKPPIIGEEFLEWIDLKLCY